MSKAVADITDQQAYGAWRARTRTSVAQFQQQSFQFEDARQAEAAIIDLVAEYLWLDLGERAAWDAFDPFHWRETIAPTDPAYRSRVRATLISFYEHLTSAGLVSVAACARIQEALAECLSDQLSSASARSSYVRFAGEHGRELEATIPRARRS